MVDPLLLTIEELEELRGTNQVAELAGTGSPTDRRRRVEAALAKAGAEAVSELHPRYGDETPRTPEEAPAVLKEQVATAALYHLVVDGSTHPPDEVIRRYHLVLDWYRRVRESKVSLDLKSVNPTVSVREPLILTSRAAPRFTGQLGEMLP